MANYKVNEKSKTISVSGNLTDIERSIISTYISNGYKVKEKKNTGGSDEHSGYNHESGGKVNSPPLFFTFSSYLLLIPYRLQHSFL